MAVVNTLKNIGQDIKLSAKKVNSAFVQTANIAGANAPIKKSSIKFIQRLPPPGKIISREEAIMQQLFNGEPTFGTGTCLPKINGILRRGRGLINSGDAGETGSMFGI